MNKEVPFHSIENKLECSLNLYSKLNLAAFNPAHDYAEVKLAQIND